MAWEKTPKSRSYPCNGDLVRQRRLHRRWTQEDLAAIAKFSVRLIAKAESGGSLHPDTVEHLAAVLSTPASPLFPEDLIASPKQLALEFVRNLKLHQGQVVSKCQHLLAEDVRFFMQGNPEVLPFSGHHADRTAMDKACGTFFRTLEIVRPERWQTEFAVCEGNEVVVAQWIPAQLRGLADRGILVANAILVVNRLRFKRGRIVALDDYFLAEEAEIEIARQQAMLSQASQ